MRQKAGGRLEVQGHDHNRKSPYGSRINELNKGLFLKEQKILATRSGVAPVWDERNRIRKSNLAVGRPETYLDTGGCCVCKS